jgi:hypothetical protein
MSLATHQRIHQQLNIRPSLRSTWHTLTNIDAANTCHGYLTGTVKPYHPILSPEILDGVQKGRKATAVPQKHELAGSAQP